MINTSWHFFHHRNPSSGNCYNVIESFHYWETLLRMDQLRQDLTYLSEKISALVERL